MSGKKRAAMLCPSPDVAMAPFVEELAKRHYLVSVYNNPYALLEEMRLRSNELRLVVLAPAPLEERVALLDKLILATRFNTLHVFWLTERGSPDADPNELRHELRGPRDSIKVLLFGDIAMFRLRLDYVDALIAKHTLPVVTFVHTRPANLRIESEVHAYARWLARHGCSPSEVVVDVLLDGRSLRDATKGLPDPIRPFDLYVLDRLGQAFTPMTIDDLTRSLVDIDSYAFAQRLELRSSDGYTHASVRNAIKRDRAGLTALGVDGHAVLPCRERRYFIDRDAVRLEVNHIGE